MPLSHPLILGLLATALALCLLAALLVLHRDKSERLRARKRIEALQQKIEAALHDEGFDAERLAFGTALKAASLTTELQRPRLDTLAKLDKRPPEKYRILSKLASQGLEVEEIAAILGISSVEAGQLLSLSAMAKYGR